MLRLLGLLIIVSNCCTSILAQDLRAVHELSDEKKVSTNTVKSKKPNILFILTEDQGAHLSFLNTPGLQTPHIDSIAKSGTYFQNAFVVYPVCSASKAALYTGLHSHTNGILNNTYNFHKPASEVTDGERNMQLSKTNRIRDQYLTLTEILNKNGYYQGVTHKLHVLPNRKFPYDEFLHGGKAEIDAFLSHAKQHEQPFFLMVNIPNSHRPYPNSDKTTIRVNPAEVDLPAYLPDSLPIRQDWAEYLAGIEEADKLTGQALAALKNSGLEENTLVVFMSDHGPTFQHGKMTLYDLGLRVPLIVSGPGIGRGKVSNALVNELDLLPTLLDWIKMISGESITVAGNSNEFPYPLHGASLLVNLTKDVDAVVHDHIFAEISNLGPLPNDGIQERSVFDGRFKLIYRENVEKRWRQVNADSREFPVWGNRTYRETVRLKDQFPRQYQILTEMDPQELNGEVPALELYDLQSDPDEMTNLITIPEQTETVRLLMNTLRAWSKTTGDRSLTFTMPPLDR